MGSACSRVAPTQGHYFTREELNTSEGWLRFQGELKLLYPHLFRPIPFTLPGLSVDVINPLPQGHLVMLDKNDLLL